MKTKPKYFFLIVVLSICLVACKTINNGVILKKEFLPARTICIRGIYNHIDDRYFIIIEGENEKQKMTKAKIYVSKQTYDSLSIGDIYKNQKLKNDEKK